MMHRGIYRIFKNVPLPDSRPFITFENERKTKTMDLIVFQKQPDLLKRWGAIPPTTEKLPRVEAISLPDHFVAADPIILPKLNQSINKFMTQVLKVFFEKISDSRARV
jgi:hypothetical protein